jgi:hypothetical protein
MAASIYFAIQGHMIHPLPVNMHVVLIIIIDDCNYTELHDCCMIFRIRRGSLTVLAITLCVRFRGWSHTVFAINRRATYQVVMPLELFSIRSHFGSSNLLKSVSSILPDISPCTFRRLCRSRVLKHVGRI